MSTTDEQWSAMSKIVNTFFQKPDAEPFREPVDWEALGLFDYPQIIKKPMDLGTIKKKLAERQYSSLMECNDDVKLVWTNCMTYNADGSDFFVLAKSLAKKWDEKYLKLLQDHEISPDAATMSANGDNGKLVPLEEKRSFAKLIHKLTKEELGRILVILDEKCPQALTKNATEDEVELNIDNITQPLFQDLVKFSNECLEKRKSTKKGAPTTGNKKRAT